VPDTPSIFVSHAHEDKPLARGLTAALTERGYYVWLDEVELRIGDSLVERIADAIAEGDFVLAIVSPHSLASNWCQQELSWAATKGIANKRVVVLPIRYGGAEMPAVLADRLWADADAADVEQLADRIAGDIERHRAEAAPAAGSGYDGEEQQAAAPPDPAVGLRALDAIAERTFDLLAQWDRCRTGADQTDALVDKQRRLKLSLSALPGGTAALAVVAELAQATWNDYFRPRMAAEVEPDVMTELDAVRMAIAHGQPLTARWRIVGTLGEVDPPHGKDAVAYLWEIVRADEARRVAVMISRSAMASTIGLPSEVVEAKTTEGRSAVLRYVGNDDPPREVLVSTAGITP
jgi:hypothetical protein